jgi:putative tryptophan/tyrosine transport system substrate-binding protein
MKRREFITLLGGAAVAWPLAARTQQSAMPVIGFLHSLSAQAVAARVAAFRDGVKEGGLAEGRDVTLEFRWAEGEYDRLPGLANELATRATVIVAGSTPAARAAKAATQTIPIVFTGVGGDPVKLGLVPSLNRPGNNITGISLLSIALVPKRLELLRELAPKARTIGALVNPTNPNAEITVPELTSAAKTLGINLALATAKSEREVATAFAKFAEQRAGGVVVDSDPFFLAQRYRLVTLAARYNFPAIYEVREFIAAGGLISYGPNTDDAYHQAGLYTARILKGTKPGDLPVTQPTKFELAINLQTAKALDVEVPATLLARADEVIE